MEKGEEENGGENNPNNKNGDGDNLDSGGNGSDETGVDPAEHTGENGTAVVSNGKTDDNQNKKDTSQESQEQSDNIPAPDAAEHDTLTSEVPVKTDTSKSKQEPGPGSSSNEPMQRLQVTEHDNGASQFEGDEGPEEAAVTQLLATLYYTTSPEGQGTDPGMPIETSRAMSSGNGITILPTPDSPGQALKLKADGKVPKPSDKDQGASDLSDEKENTNASECEAMTGDESSPEVPKQSDEAQDVTDRSDKTLAENTDASDFEVLTGDGFSSDEEAKTEIQVTDHDNGASQRKEDEQFCDADANTSDTEEVSQAIQPDSLGGPGTTPDMPEETTRTKSSENESTNQPTKDSPEVKKSKAETQAATDSPIITSEETGNTNASRSEGTGSSSVNEPMKRSKTTEHDNGASQGGKGGEEGGGEFQIAVDTTSGKTGVSLKIVKPKNPGDGRAPPPKNEQSGSKNLQSESGSSHAGHVGGKGVEETEAQKRDANGRSEEEIKTGSGANKDDKDSQPKEKKAKGEGGTAHAVKTEQHVIKERPVSISLCTSAYSFNVEGLVSYLKGLMKKHPKLIKEVKIHELPYNDLDHYRFDEKDPVDVMILCHSINNRRFAITDVMDALYDEYLPYCARVVGKEKMGVIVHDFDDMRETVQSSRMSSFKYKQPKTFETTSLQITCGQIEKEEQVRKQMLKEDRKKIFEFLENASKHPEKIMTMRDIETRGQKAKRIVKQAGDSVSSLISSVTGSIEARWSSTQQAAAVPHTYPASDVDTGEPKPEEKFPVGRKNDNSQSTKRARDESQPSNPNAKRTDLSGSDPAGDLAQERRQTDADLSSQSQMSSASGSTSAPQRSLSQPTPLTEPRSTSVSICSSAYQHNVKGLVCWLTNFKAKHPHMINDVRFRSLPYNNIDSFRFPTDDPVDVMVLCHSVQNRGFSITNVLNALYEEYLKYCHDVIGKKKLALIVHDFTDLKPSTMESRMESFRRSQPLTFEFVDTAIICGSLEDPAKLGMTEEDETRLICFLERARLVPEENTELEQSFVGRLKKYFSS